MYSLYRNPDLDDRIFDCLLASMAAVHADDVRASFLFVGDMNGHHQELLGSTTTNRDRVAAFVFATVCGCDQLVVGPTQALGGTLNLLITDVPDLVWADVVAPIGNSGHSSLSAVISMAQAVPTLFVRRKVFLKHKVNWNSVCGAIWELPWLNISLSDNPVEALNEHLSLLDGRYVPTKDKPSLDDQCRLAFGLKQEAHLWWTRDRSWVNWEEFVHYQVKANETYSEARHQFSDRNRDVLMNVQSPHKWWSTLKFAVFGSSSALPPLDSEGGGLVCESISKADRLSDHFDSKQSREAVDLPLTCRPSPSLTTFALRLREVRRLLLDLNPYGGTDPLGMFHFFLYRTADVMAPHHSVVFRRLVRHSLLPGDRPMSPQFQKVHSPLLLRIIDQFP